MKLKVCGMKYQDNITQVAALQPDYLGFIFYEKSSRFFNEIIPELPKAIKKVGVFVDASLEFILNKIETHQLDVIQLHGQEPPKFCNELRHAELDSASKKDFDCAQSDTVKFLTLRQQLKKRESVPNFALADFIAPKESGIQDYIGCFCVSTGFGTEQLAKEFEANHDDYNSIMIKALADRLAEAFAEYLHQKVRTDFWGYASNENLSNQELIKEAYKGIRPAPGYPACPDHLEKMTIWDILKVEETIGVKLTESLAMWPAASVSGYYFANPEAKYFGLGKITEDQLDDYTKRRQISKEDAEKWLSPNLAD